MSLVSVIIPTFNRCHVLRNAVNSVLSQTYRHIEIIIVDDGSTDATEAVISLLPKQNKRIYSVKHPFNRGAQAARNTGIKKARGEWIAFLDSDDVLVPKSVELRIKTAQKEKVSAVHSECFVIREGERRKIFGVPPLSGNIYPAILVKPGPVFPALLVAREAFVKINFLDERIRSYQEWDTVIRLAKYYHFGFVAEPTFVYDCRGEDTISKNMLLDAKGYERVFHKHCLEIVRQLGMQGLINHYQFVAKRYRLAGYIHDVRRCERTVRYLSFVYRKLQENRLMKFLKTPVIKAQKK